MANFKSPFSRFRWRVRITLWLAAALAGLLVVAFAKLTDFALSLFYALYSQHSWSPLFLTPVIGMIAAWLTHKYFNGAQGSGIPQVIAAAQLASKGKCIDTLVSIKIAIGKILVGSLALMGGFSVGREGPSVQVAASVLHAAHRFLPHSRALKPADLILAGGAAGVAAAFNTPLAGIVFAIEELARRMEIRTSGVLISTIILSGLVSMALLGNYSYFGKLKIVSVDYTIGFSVVIGGLVCGVLGGAFSKLLLWPQMYQHQSIWRWRAAHPVFFAGGCGMLVALIGWMGGGFSFGSGYASTAQLVSGQTGFPWHTLITRFSSTVISFHSGIPGGIFAPSLAVGAAIGTSMTQLFGSVPVDIPMIALCMAGFLAAVTQSPATSAIIVMEMVDGHEMVISLMAISVIAKAVSSRISPELYQHLAQGWQAACETTFLKRGL